MDDMLLIREKLSIVFLGCYVIKPWSAAINIYC